MARSISGLPARFLRWGRRGGLGKASCDLGFARGGLIRRRGGGGARRPWRLGFGLGKETGREDAGERVWGEREGSIVGVLLIHQGAGRHGARAGAARTRATSGCGTHKLGRYWREKKGSLWEPPWKNFPRHG